MNNAEEFAQTLRDVAAMAGTHIVPAPLDTGERLAIPTVSLSADEFTALLRAVRPPAMYLFTSILDVGEETQSALDEAGIEEDGKAGKAVRRAAQRMSAYEGATSRVFAELVTGGVHHIAYIAASWIIAFEQDVDIIVAKAAEEDATLDQAADAATNSHVRSLAAQLVAHPAFNSGRVSFAKRRFLAKEVFPEEGDGLLNTVVELAENMHWLASAGM